MYSGNRLRELREKEGLSRDTLSEVLDISPSQIQRHENDKIPSGIDVLKYAEFYGVSADYLLGLSDDPTPAIGESNLAPHERDVITLWRQGRREDAIKAILSD